MPGTQTWVVLVATQHGGVSEVWRAYKDNTQAANSLVLVAARRQHQDHCLSPDITSSSKEFFSSLYNLFSVLVEGKEPLNFISE